MEFIELLRQAKAKERWCRARAKEESKLLQVMPKFICGTCGVQYPDAKEPPSSCPICEDERQYVGWKGQQWTTLDEMNVKGYRNNFREEESGLSSAITVPSFAIGQRSFLLRTSDGNFLWDCITYLDEGTIEAIWKLGGLAGIAVSHPHYYSSIVEYSDAFGGVPIYIHALDKKWVMRPSPNIHSWDGETTRPLPELELVNLGGHFEGGTVLYWAKGAAGKGVVLSGDIIAGVMDRRWVSFMYSFPNYIPLPATKVERIAKTMRQYEFDRLYGAFEGRQILTGAKDAVERSAKRYIEHLS